MKTRLLAIFLASLILISLCSFSASAEDSVYSGAIVGVSAFPFKTTFSVTVSYDGLEDTSESSFVRDADGDVMCILGEGTDNIYFEKVSSSEYVAVVYVSDDETCDDGWYSFEQNSMVFFYVWADELACDFLNRDYSNDMFLIKTTGNVTTLTVKDEYMQEIAYDFFGNYSDPEAGVTDVYTSVVLTVTDGTLSGISADNVYTTPEGTANYKYTVTYDSCEGITVPEYSEYVYRAPLPAEPVGELPLGREFAVDTNPVVYTYTPAVDMAVNFTSDSTSNVDTYMDIYVEDGEFFTIYDNADDNGEDLMFSGTFILRQGVTYYFAFGEYGEQASASHTVCALPLLFLGDDINGDGKITSLDAATVLRYDAGLIELDEETLAKADANGDGVVSALDASYYLMYDAGLIFEPAPIVMSAE